MPHWLENLEAIMQLYHKTSESCTFSQVEKPTISKNREREREREEKKKDYLYCNTGPKKMEKKTQWKNFCKQLKEEEKAQDGSGVSG